MGPQKIHFIVNPIAGKGKRILNEDYLEQFFLKGYYQLTVKYSEHKTHASTLTRESIVQGADIIVACGGDGTINEVASCLLGTTIPLGIVPLGSGNGLASNLNIPKNLRQALGLLQSPRTIKIDTGMINDSFFFSNTGVGFDASVIKNYESSNRRTLSGYFRACMTSFKELKRPGEIQVCINGQNMSVHPFLIFVSNTNVMGYHLSLTPQASLQDGLLDVLIISRINRFKMLLLGFLLLINKPHILKEAKHFQTTDLVLSADMVSQLDSQIDGEFHSMESGVISIGIAKNSLEIIVPKHMD